MKRPRISPLRILTILMIATWPALGLPSRTLAGDLLHVAVNNAIEVIDCDTDTIIKRIPAYDDFVMTGAYSPDGRRFYANGFETIYEVDTKTHELLNTYKLSSHLSKVTVWGFPSPTTDPSSIWARPSSRRSRMCHASTFFRPSSSYTT